LPKSGTFQQAELLNSREATMSTAIAEMPAVLRINDTAPDFTAETTQGTIHFHEWIGDWWAILFSHPKDFTPVCTTELGYMAGLQPEFAKRNCKIIGLSVDPVSDHRNWVADIEETQGHKVNYPMIGDPELKIAQLYNMLPATSGSTSQGRTPADNATVRTVFVLGPDKKIKLQLMYPISTGRNFDEVMRVLDSLQLTTKHQVSTPVNWKPGEDASSAAAFRMTKPRRNTPRAGRRRSRTCGSSPSRSSLRGQMRRRCPGPRMFSVAGRDTWACFVGPSFEGRWNCSLNNGPTHVLWGESVLLVSILRRDPAGRIQRCMGAQRGMLSVKRGDSGRTTER
jgi:alkyl hydroperoxide reductase subunit AhpC